MAHVATELVVTLHSDAPGALAAALEAIARSGLNVDGLTEEEGIAHLLTRDAPAAQKVLRAAGIRVRTEASVVVVEVADKPGAAAALFRRIANAGLNVSYCYVASGNRLIIGSDDPQSIAKILA